MPGHGRGATLIFLLTVFNAAAWCFVFYHMDLVRTASQLASAVSKLKSQDDSITGRDSGKREGEIRASSSSSSCYVQQQGDEPLVSAIIPINSEKRLHPLLNAVRSVLNQTWSKVEAVVMVDSSSQKLKELSQIFKDEPKVKVFFMEPSNGLFAGHVRNEGVKRASGRYIAFLDCDDLWINDKVELQVKYMMRNNLSFSCTEAYTSKCCNRWSNDGRDFKDWYPAKDPQLIASMKLYNAEVHLDILKSLFKPLIDYKAAAFPSRWDLQWISKHNTVITTTVMLSKELFDKSDKFPPDVKSAEDWILWTHLLTKHTQYVGYIDTPLAIYDWWHGGIAQP